MSLWSMLFGGSKPKRRSKKASKKVAKKATKKGVKRFVIFDKDTDRVLERVEAKTESQAWKSWASKGLPSDGIRIMSASRWDKESH